MKVCLIHNAWEKSARRGAEQLLLAITEALHQRGDEVVIIAARPWRGYQEKQPGVYFLGSGYASLEYWPKALRLLWHVFNILNPVKYFQVRKILDQEKPDVVWTHNLVGLGILVFLLCRNRQHIHTIHDIQLLHPSGLLMYGQEGMIASLPARLYQFLGKSLMPVASVIVSPSAWLLRLHHERGFFKHNRTVVIPNPTAFARSEREPISNKQTFDFLYVGQIEAHKGVDILLHAFKHLKDPLARLRLIGDGSLLSKLKLENTDTRVEFLGRQESAGVKKIMLTSDCLVVPSNCYENQPTVILEAFATGLPVIGSCFGGTKELLGNEEVEFEPTVESLLQKLAEVVKKDWQWPAIVKHEENTPVQYLEKVFMAIS